MPSFLRPLISAVLIGLSVLGLMNVYSDNSAVEAQAGQLACQGCSPRLVQLGRSPVSQSLTFQTGPGTLVSIDCRRKFIFLGDYECTVASAAH
jgi:hypothetical protein